MTSRTTPNNAARNSAITKLEAAIDLSIRNSGAEFDVARVAAAYFENGLVYSNNSVWWWFSEDEHRWKRDKEGHHLSKMLSTKIADLYKTRGTYWKAQASQDEDNRDKYETYSKCAFLIALNLANTVSKKHYIKECSALLHNDKFEEELLNEKPHLMGFTNGVYDFKEKVFRDGRPDDYISFSTNIKYVPYDPESNEAQIINDFLAKVFVNDELRTYYTDMAAMTLDGSIRREQFLVATGSGANGKSKANELQQKCMGDYYCIIPIALLTQKRAASNSAQSELERTKGRRFAVLQEPSEGETINIGLMKELTGGDRIQARGLFKEPVEFKPQFKMMLVCNDLPEVPSNDGGTWRRIRVLQYKSKFVDEPRPNKPNEFEMDTSLSEKLTSCAPMFISMLIEHHKTLDLANLYEPLAVTSATTKYKSGSNLINQYTIEAITKDVKSSTRIRLNDVYADMKTWAHKNGIQNKRIPDRNAFKSALEAEYGQYPRDGWTGLVWKTIGRQASAEDEDDSEETENVEDVAMEFMKEHIVHREECDVSCKELKEFVMAFLPQMDYEIIERYIVDTLKCVESKHLIRNGKRTTRGFKSLAILP